MKKKVYYKLNRYKVAKVEVESVEQEQAVKILNRETDCYITIDVLNEAENSPLHLIRYFYGGDRYAKE